LPVLAAFTLTHPQHVAGGIDIPRLELSGFADAESTTVQQRQQRTVAKTAGRFEQRFNLLAAEDRWQPSFASWEGDAFDRDFTVERMGIEEAPR
jgi:hypothetical protein